MAAQMDNILHGNMRLKSLLEQHMLRICEACRIHHSMTMTSPIRAGLLIDNVPLNQSQITCALKLMTNALLLYC